MSGDRRSPDRRIFGHAPPSPRKRDPKCWRSSSGEPRFARGPRTISVAMFAPGRLRVRPNLGRVRVRRPVVGLLGLALVCGSIATGGAAASAVSTDGAKAPSAVSKAKGQNHDLPNPLEEKRRAEREAALQAVLDGTATPVQRGGSTVVDIGTAALAKPANAYSRARSAGYSTNKTHNYVELARETTDRIFVILAEFGNERDPAYPDVDSDPDTPGPTVFDGPLHNQIPKPGRRPTTRPSGRRTRTAPSTRRRTSAPATASSRSRPTTSASARVATASTAPSPTG